MTKKQGTAGAKIEDLVEKAKGGDRYVLEEIVRRIQDRIYGLAIRMLFIPADAEDATQEILMKVITHLGTFKGKSRFETWVHRIAANHLLTMRKGRAESWRLTFDKCSGLIEEGTLEEGAGTFFDAEQHLVVEETKLACVHYLLLCLKREVRLAYILGEILGVGSAEGAEILDLTPAAYRQRLSRGKKRLTKFLAGKCGLVDPGNPCRCGTLAALHVKKKHIDPKNLLFATHAFRPRRDGWGKDLVKELDVMARAAMLLRNHPDYAAPGVFVASMKGLIDSGRFQLLGGREKGRG